MPRWPNQERLMKIPKLAAVTALFTCIVASGTFAAEPVQNVDPSRHGNIARAQELSRQAYDAMTAAQNANEFDMGGHAANAKNLLAQANQEMKLAALAANKR
jgi:hypothetical protein